MNLIKAVLCQCGCGQTIAPKRHHKYREPRFLPGHNTRITPVKRKYTSFQPPPEVLPLLTGVCGCGCGEHTPIAKQSRPAWFQYKGYPLRYIHGHHARGVTGDRTSRWAGGRIMRHGYILLKRHGHPMADSIGYIQEHRLVMSEQLGRYLERYEHVHHKNGDRADNRPENLELMLIHQHPIGQRAEDLVNWARDILRKYSRLYPEPS